MTPETREGLDEPIVSIVILNWNSYEDTKQCIESLGRIDYDDYSIIVVDNGSSDGSKKRLEEYFDNIEIISTRKNKGFAGAANIGIKRGIDQGAEFVLLLNNDTTVEEDFLGHLVEAAENSKRVGMVSSVIKFADSNTIQSAGRSVNLQKVQSPHWRTLKGDEPYETEAISGACVLFTKAFFGDCGLLDESFFFGGEDVEISLRAQREDWKILVHPDSVVYHEAGTTSENSCFTWYHRIYGRYTISADYHSRLQRIKYHMFMMRFMTRRTIKWVRKKRYDLIFVTVLAIVDHIFGINRRVVPNEP